jgi:hypothetical protein
MRSDTRLAAAGRRAADERRGQHVFVAGARAGCGRAAVAGALAVVRIRAIQLEGELAPQQRRLDPRQRRAAAGGNFFSRPGSRARRLRGVPWVRRRRCAASGPTGWRCNWRSTGRWRCGKTTTATTAWSTPRRGLRGQRRRRRGRPTARVQRPDGSSAQMLALYRRLEPVFSLQTHATGGSCSSPAAARGAWSWTTAPRCELGRGSEDELAERADRFVRTHQPGHRSLPARRWSTPTCATPTATPCAARHHHHPHPGRQGGQETSVAGTPMAKEIQGPRRRPGHRHRQGDGGGRRGAARRRAARGRAGRGAGARPEARRGRQHRRHRAEHPAGAEGGRDDGRLQDRARSTPASPAATSAARTAPAW